MSVYDITQTIPSPETLQVGDILNCPYSGAEVAITLPKGRYKLEVWGAAGGNGWASTNYLGGKGGYAYGTLNLNSAQSLYVYSGGKGVGIKQVGSQPGGFNGGGAGGYGRGGSGGGASDIRIGANTLENRVIVAGGGGGGAYQTGFYGGAGGGTNGIDGSGYSTTYNAKGGTQSSGGAGSSYNGGGNVGNSGSLGQGGAAASTNSSSYGRSGGGGGGYYGGGGGGFYASSNYYYGQSGGGGGSGYVDSSLTDAETISGANSFIDYDGSTVTGHSGDGAARITVLYIMPVLPELIYDRTAQDVLRRQYLAGLKYPYSASEIGADGFMTAEEKAEWDAGNLKGAYNVSDVNRVESAVDFLSEYLADVDTEIRTYADAQKVAWDIMFAVPYDPDDYTVTVKTDWSVDDIPLPSDMTRYLDNVALLITALEAAYPTLPTTMNSLTYDGANAIERALFLLYEALNELKAQIKTMIDNTALAWYYSGDIYAGEI